MIWKTTNGLGQEVVWYSEDEIKKYKTMLKVCQKQFLNAVEEYSKLKERLKNDWPTRHTIYINNSLDFD